MEIDNLWVFDNETKIISNLNSFAIPVLEQNFEKMKFSEKVKYARMKLLLTQEALAKELGVSYATICRWEKENREPQIVSQGKFYAFCESKGIKFDD